jgi:hypothetical protein
MWQKVVVSVINEKFFVIWMGKGKMLGGACLLFCNRNVMFLCIETFFSGKTFYLLTACNIYCAFFMLFFRFL